MITIEQAARKLLLVARTSGGVAGRDEELCKACDEMEAALIAPTADMRERARVVDAARPFATLGGDDDMQAFHDLPDDAVIYHNSGAFFTAGEVRALREAIAAHDGKPASHMHFRRPAIADEIDRKIAGSIVFKFRGDPSAARYDKLEAGFTAALTTAHAEGRAAQRREDAALLTGIQFSQNGYCPCCGGWQYNPGRGYTPKAHTKDCPLAAAIEGGNS